MYLKILLWLEKPLSKEALFETSVPLHYIFSSLSLHCQYYTARVNLTWRL